MLNVLVIDGQGGKIGKSLVEQLVRLGYRGNIRAVGTNTVATAAMLKAGASEGATGENSVLVAAEEMDVIAGPVGIIMANSLLGEITPKMARAIAESSAKKVLVPVSKCRLTVAGVEELSLGQYIERAAQIIAELGNEAQGRQKHI